MSAALLTAALLTSLDPTSHQGTAAVLEPDLPQGSYYAAAYGTTTAPGFVTTFFSRTGSDGSPAWYAVKREAGEAGEGASVWASGSECPALYAALDWLADIRPPSVAISGLRRLPADATTYELRPRTGPAADGPTWWVSGSGWGPDRSLVHLSLRSTGGYIAEWAEATTRHLAPCWRTESPF